MISVIRHREGAQLPKKMHDGDTGYDLFSAEMVTIAPRQTAAVPTGLSFDLTGLPDHVEMQIRPRSGLALVHGITVLNSPGTIDREYVGEVQVILHNTGEVPYTVIPGQRIAQAVFAHVFHPEFKLVEKQRIVTSRGTNGFGSTGLS